MGILLILAQVVLTILVPVAHVFTVSPWLTCLPMILFCATWLIAVLCGGSFYIDRLNPIGPRVKRGRR